MEKAVLGRQEVEVAEVAPRHQLQIQMTQHRPLGATRCSAGVEDPGECIPVGGRGLDRLAHQLLVLRVIDTDHARRARSACVTRQCGSNAVGMVGRHQAECSLAVLGDEGDFARVQLGVHRNGHQPGMPDPEQHLQVGGAVAHRDHDAVTASQALRQETTGKFRDAMRKLPIREAGLFTDGDRGPVRIGASRISKQDGNVHGRSMLTTGN